MFMKYVNRPQKATHFALQIEKLYISRLLAAAFSFHKFTISFFLNEKCATADECEYDPRAKLNRHI